MKRGGKSLFFDKKGGLFSKKDSYSSDSEKSSNGKLVATLIILILVAGGGWFLFKGFYSSDAGALARENVANAFSGISEWVGTSIEESTTSLEYVGSGDLFGRKTNSESKTKGIILEDLNPIGYSSQVGYPAGYDFQLYYDIEFQNIEDYVLETEFECFLNDSTDQESLEEAIEGEIKPSYEVSLTEGTQVSCNIDGTDTESLDGAYTITGWLEFDFATEEVKLPVYVISGELADDLDRRNVDFFDEQDLDVSRGDLEPLYNGEPMSIGMGVFGEGDQQPLIVRTGDSFNTIGFTLRNEWDGDIVNIENLYLSLPDDIQLDEGLNDLPSLGCPFEEVGGFRNTIEYSMAEDFKDLVFIKDEYGKINFPISFQCWLNVDYDILGTQAYDNVEIMAEIEYRYRSTEVEKSIIIKGEGESLIETNNEESFFE
ncbi:hypothetical protein HN681_05000 [archaeon]|nr:hypothetical protein [archaeon]